MKRRDFLKGGSALSLPFLLNGFPINASARNPLLELLRQQTAETGKVLVLIQMNGGNDGLNTLIPLDQYSQLSQARSNILIPANRVLALNGMPQTGLHPSMNGMANLYNNGQMNIVQGVSYENPNFSHFRATDIWFTGSASEQFLNTGWLGRSLQAEYPGYPVGYPTTDMPDPLTIQIGSQASIATQCPTVNTAVTITNPDSFYKLVSGNVADAPDTPYGHELTFLRLIRQQTNAYTDIISNAYNPTANLVNYPGNNPLANQLKIVANLIKGGLKTPVYVVNHPTSFDTHASQVEILDTTAGNHAALLQLLSEAVSAFQQDLTAMGISERVAAMTFTEFGRRIKSNDSLGTDHGTATPIFFFGGSLNPTIVGSNPVIPQNVTSSDQVPMQYDFKAVYYTVLKDWFSLTDDQLKSVLPDSYTTLPIFKQVALPVHLLSFTGSWTSNVNLQWKTEQESGIDHYDVQRSDDGNNFSTIGSVNSVNSIAPYTYSYTDTALSKSAYYYRIRIIEKSGAIEYSDVLLLKTNQVKANRAKIFPNPVTDRFTISFENKVSGTVTIRLMDLSGKEVWKREQQTTDTYNLNFSLNGKKPATGIYMVKMQSKNEEMTAKILIK